MVKKLNDIVTLRHGAKLSNRIAMSPMLTYSGKRGGFVSDDTLSYYSARSQAAGMLITEFHYVSENGGPAYPVGYPEQLGAYSDKHIDGLSKLAQELKKMETKQYYRLIMLVVKQLVEQLVVRMF